MPQSQRRTRDRQAAWSGPDRAPKACSSGPIWQRHMEAMKAAEPPSATGDASNTAQASSTSALPTYIGLRVIR